MNGKIIKILQIAVNIYFFCLNVPNLLVEEVLRCKDNIDVRKVGVEWAIQQTKELIQFGVPCIHFYTMGKSDNVQQIVGSFS